MADKFSNGNAKDRREAWMLFLQQDGNMDNCETVLTRRIELINKLCAPELPDQFAIGVCPCADAACASQFNLASSVQLCIFISALSSRVPSFHSFGI